MKKNTRFSPFEIRPITILAITFVVLLLGRSAFAGPMIPIHTLDITENSSTSLTVLYDGSDVTASVVGFTSPDNWTLTFDPSIQFGVFNQFWTEPEDANFVNVVFQNGPNDSNVLFVISDNPNTGGAVPDNTSQLEPGTVSGVQSFFNTTFHDHGDAAVGVPEGGSTLTLSFLSLAALFGASRLRAGRFA